MTTQDGDVVEVTFIHDNDTSGEQINRYQFRKKSGGPLDDAGLLEDISQIMEALYVALQAAISIRNVFREIGVFNVTQSLIIGTTDAGAYVGGLGNDPALPQGVAGFVYFKTNVPRVILSKYLPSAHEVRLTADGKWTSVQLAFYVAFVAALLADWDMAGQVYEYGYLSPKTLAWVVPDLGVIPPVPGYMRRRKPGRGS